MFGEYRSSSSDGAIVSMRWRTAAHISVARSPTDSSTTWRFDARGTDHDLPSTTAPSLRGHRPSRSHVLTSAFGPDRSRYGHDGNQVPQPVPDSTNWIMTADIAPLGWGRKKNAPALLTRSCAGPPPPRRTYRRVSVASPHEYWTSSDSTVVAPSPKFG